MSETQVRVKRHAPSPKKKKGKQYANPKPKDNQADFDAGKKAMIRAAKIELGRPMGPRY